MSTVYQRLWIKYNGPIPKDECGRSFDIHHKDGNHTNDTITNLQCVSIQEHYDIHWNQGDYGACQSLAIRMMLSPEKISHLASLAAKRQVENGTHPLLDKDKAKERFNHRIKETGSHPILDPIIRRNAQKQSVVKGTHIFLNSEYQRKVQSERIKNGTHHLLNGTIQRTYQNKLLLNGTHSFIQEHVCPYCNKIGKGPQMFRYHFDNCKLK